MSRWPQKELGCGIVALVVPDHATEKRQMDNRLQWRKCCSKRILVTL